MKTFLASVAAVGLIGGTAFAQSIVLVPQGEGAAGQQFILVPVPQEGNVQQGGDQQGAARQGAGQQAATQQQARQRAEAMALDLYRRGYRRGMADAVSRTGAPIDPAAMEQIGRELFERGYMLGVMQARAQMTADQTAQPGGQPAGDEQAAAAAAGKELVTPGQIATAGQAAEAEGTQAGQAQAGQAQAAQQGQAAQGQGTQSETVAAEGPQVVIGSAESDEYGTYLADDAGRPVYMLEADQQGTGEAQAQSTCYDDCAEAWPPVTSPAKPLAEDMANEEMLSTIEREGGGNQVTYNGWPLYYYAEAEGSDQPAGQDVHDEWGEWYLLKPNGEPVGHE